MSSQSGTILAGEELTLQAKRLHYSGTFASAKNADIRLQDDLTVDADIQAGDTLMLQTAGTITNTHKIEAGRSLTLEAQQLDNAADGSIQAQDTLHAVVETLTNRGLINSQGLTHLEAGTSLTNLGTGRIYGNHVAVDTPTLVNKEEGDKSGTIAARERLDLGVQSLTNQEHAELSSLGTLHIGGGLDASQQATGQAELVDNASAKILSTGDMSIAADTITNRNLHFKTSVKEVPGSRRRVMEYVVSGGKLYQQSDISWIGGKGTIYLKNGESYERYTRRGFTYLERQTYVDESDPAEILSGGMLSLTGSSITNDKSHILANGIEVTGASVQNLEPKGEHREVRNGTWSVHSIRKKNFRHRSHWDGPYGYHPADVVTEIDLNVVKYDDHYQGAAGGTVAENANMERVAAVNADNATPEEIRTVTPDTTLPNQSLFSINEGNNNRPFIETDPAFTNFHRWLGSDYMLNALGQDPQQMQKRLGDGFYEQRLVTEQIAHLTGKVFLEGYSDAEAQFQHLMDAGITAAKEFHLTPGIALSAEQVAQLTSDIVWLVSQKVVLPDGRETTALVPKVYVVVRPGDIDGTGALIAADTVKMNLTGDFNNQGTVAGRRVVDLGAKNVNNLGGLIRGGNVQVVAQDDIVNRGGQMVANKVLQLNAGRDIQNITTTHKADQSGGGSTYTRENVDRVAALYVKDSDGLLSANAGRDLQMAGSTASSEDSMSLSAGRDVKMETVTEAHRDHSYHGEYAQLLDAESKEVGNHLQAKGDIRVQSGGATNIRASEIDSKNGSVDIAAQGGVTIEDGRQVKESLLGTKEKSSGLFSSTTTLRKEHTLTDRTVASTVTGKTVRVVSGDTVTIKGSNVVSDERTAIAAKNDVNIVAATDSSLSETEVHKKKSGLMGSGGIGFTIGTKKIDTNQQGARESTTASNVGSLHGDTLIGAGEAYRQVGSTVSSPEGNVVVGAKRIDVEAAQVRSTTDTEYTYQQKGLTVAFNAPALSLIQSAQSLATSAKDTTSGQNARVTAMAAANTGFKAYQTGKALNQFAKDPKGEMQTVSVSITYGQQKNKNESHMTSTSANPSQVLAGGQVVMSAKGDGANSDISIVGSDVYGKAGTRLTADDQISLLTSKQTETERSQNKSAGWNAGVAISFGNGVSFGATAGGNYGRGHGNGDTVTNRQTHVGSLDGNTVLESGGTTTLQGAQVQGKRVDLTAKDLHIESVQDTFQYDAKQMNASAQVTVGYGFSGSASFNKSKLKSDYASVTEQSGILAGDEGYNVKVQDHTSLKGGLVTSTQKAEDEGKNSFTTGALSTEDIHNHSETKGSAIGLDMSVSLGSRDTKKDQEKATPDGKTQESSTEDQSAKDKQEAQDLTQEQSRQAIQDEKNSWKGTSSLGLGKVSESDSGTTKSGINTKNLTVVSNPDGDFAAVHTTATTDNYREHMGSVEKTFDKEKLLNDLNVQVRVTKDFRHIATETMNQYFDDKQAKLIKERDEWEASYNKTNDPEVLERSKENILRLDNEIYKLEYSRNLATLLIDVVSSNPKAAVTRSTLETVSTMARQESLWNSRFSPGITDGKTIINNTSQRSGAFDGVKLGGTRLSLVEICEKHDYCQKDKNGNYVTDIRGNYIFDKDKAKKDFSTVIKEIHEEQGGATGGVQGLKGAFMVGGYSFSYLAGSIPDYIVEYFGGIHDLTGGQLPGFYDKYGNTIKKGPVSGPLSEIVTALAIGWSAPVAISDAIPLDLIEFARLLPR